MCVYFSFINTSLCVYLPKLAGYTFKNRKSSTVVRINIINRIFKFIVTALQNTGADFSSSRECISFPILCVFQVCTMFWLAGSKRKGYLRSVVQIRSDFASKSKNDFVNNQCSFTISAIQTY
jgi:hypothetical protein